MKIDLEALVELHPGLPDEVAGMMAFGAAVALGRRHEPGVLLALDLAGKSSDDELVWRKRGAVTADKIDEKRATEEGAEGIALGIVGHHRPRWRLVRRLQSGRGERADWLFAGPNGAFIVLEISGTDAAAIGPRENEKRAQAASSAAARRAAACVVRFLEPRASLWETETDEPC
ncbi:hypothetical protein [Sorangium sp. So ce131]|uniref:hypothetical protein n=1 Tax=Sorangium sp. So ce131 TaxID=3133282 RepID=UPI003F609F7C